MRTLGGCLLRPESSVGRSANNPDRPCQFCQFGTHQTPPILIVPGPCETAIWLLVSAKSGAASTPSGISTAVKQDKKDLARGDTGMSKVRPIIGTDGLPLPVLPPERDPRVWARLVRVMFYTPGFLALLLLKAGEPTSFGITVELLMLSSTAAIVGGLYIGTQSSDAGADRSSKVGTWSGALVLELLAMVPLLCAMPALFHELAHSRLLHAVEPGAVDVTLGASELLPAVAILPFLLYQLAGFGTMHFVVPKVVNWAINIGAFCLIMAAYVANREGAYAIERRLTVFLVVAMATMVVYGVVKLRHMQATYDAHCPPKPPK